MRRAPRPANPKLQLQPWQSVTESDDRFLALFPHRFDYLWAAHPEPGERPEWKTESRHPLSDRSLQEGAHLYGVRFGKLTRYCVLDIDRHSAYHPTRDPFAIKRMVAALEAIGLVSYIAVTSSYSGGLHLYFPFTEAQESWAIALVVSTLLEHAGCKLRPGQLEVFPNPRPYTNGTPSLYTGHRVPMQAGSYLLNDDWDLVYGDQATFVRQWQWAEQRNTFNHKALRRTLKQAQRRRYKNVTVSAQKFLNDLDTEVEQGWTGAGQTNRLLGRIAMREYVFGHILRGGEPITGQALVDAIVTVAVELPGYQEHCQHQHEIDKLASDWARDIEASSRYYPYDPSKRREPAPPLESQPQNNIVSFNQQLALDAAQRIKAAIATLQATNRLPTGTAARADAIIALARCSNQTLHKYKALWHPEHIKTGVAPHLEAVTDASAPVADPLAPSTVQSPEPLSQGNVHPIQPNKFRANPAAPSEQAGPLKDVGGAGGLSTGQAFPDISMATGSNESVLKPQVLPTGQIDSPVQEPELSTTAAESLVTDQVSLAPVEDSDSKLLAQAQSSGNRRLSPVTGTVTGAAAAITQWATEKRQRRQAAHLAKMQAWLASGDPILVQEAAAWFAAQASPSQLQADQSDPGG